MLNHGPINAMDKSLRPLDCNILHKVGCQTMCAVGSDFSNNYTVKKSMLPLPTPTRGSPALQKFNQT